MITTELKDSVLNLIADNASDLYASFDIHTAAKEFNTGHRTIDALLREYEGRGFMRVQRMLGGHVSCDLEVAAYDFIKGGGYAFEESVAAIQLEKLKLELETLEGSIPTGKYNLIMTSIGAIATALSLFKK